MHYHDADVSETDDREMNQHVLRKNLEQHRCGLLFCFDFWCILDLLVLRRHQSLDS
jgi:hypothetical protein